MEIFTTDNTSCSYDSEEALVFEFKAEKAPILCQSTLPPMKGCAH